MSTPSLQQALADALLQHFPTAEVKKINKDNYVDIHLPWVHPKRGTHLGFNTAGNSIKIVFYCREDEWVQQAVANGGGLLEQYSQGVRLKGHPEFSDVKSAIAATLMFIELLAPKSTPVTPVEASETYTFEKAVKAYLKGDLEYVAAYVQAGNPVLQFNGSTLITNELISYVCTYTEVDQLIVDLVEAGVDLDASFDDGEGYTAVHFAAWDGKDEILSYLLEAGAKADIVGEDGYTPIFLAAAGGHLDCVKLLVENGADVNRRLKDNNIYFSKQGGTPLTVAFINGFLGMALYLIESGADPLVLKEPCQNAPSPDLFVNFSSLLKQRQINLPLEGQLEEILSLVGKDGEESDEEVVGNTGSLDLNEFLKEMDAGEEEDSSEEELEEEEINLDELIKKFVEKQGTDDIMDLLDSYLQKGQIVVVEISAFDLIKTLSSNAYFGDFVSVAGTVDKGDSMWADLSELIGESEADWVKEEFKEENPDSIVLLYCGGKYVYAFSNPISHNETVNAEEAEENKGLFDLNEFLDELEADTNEETSNEEEETEVEESKDGLDLASFLESMELEEDADESEEQEDESEEEEELGYPIILWWGENIDNEKLDNYAYKWQTKSEVYGWVTGILGFIPDWFEDLSTDEICPAFSPQELLGIANRVANEKIIPVLSYVPDELFLHVKRVWWIVPFCIWKEDIASFVFIDKNGFYAMCKNKQGEVGINYIFPWDKVSNLEFETEYAADSSVNRLTLYQDNGGFLTFDEFVGVGDDGKLKGSYLAVVESIWLTRKATIKASKGVPMWYEGKGGEGFVEFEKPQDLLKADSWDNPSRPDPSMYGG
ncbi:MAG: ankyrin repeat domain-containing protein [Algoriphagus sp.]|nr:ankyrin repeat domain-containing protein [Algoriphagus sp.]